MTCSWARAVLFAPDDGCTGRCSGRFGGRMYQGVVVSLPPEPFEG
jgi:hypothetical protein